MKNGRGRPKQDGSDLIPLALQPCAYHYPEGKLDYLAWHHYAHQQYQRGKRQKQCPDCGRWLFKEEIGEKNNLNVSSP